MAKAGLLNTAEQYRTRALEVRSIANQLTENAAAAREALLEVAEEYERMAVALDTRGSSGKSGGER